jgi:superfamily I DNA/RNA helicase
MADRRLLNAAIQEIRENSEQLEAVFERGHCVVLAGPGSGKTKTLTVAMARALLEDVREPRGIACITYNNECAIELETRLSRLGVEPSDRVFIGTIHSFALTQVILPYARCAMPEVASGIRIATRSECRKAIETAHSLVLGDNENPHERWKFAEEKRRRDVDRDHPSWRGKKMEYDIPIVRADNNALVKRSSRLSRFVEACAGWVAGGWKEAKPPFRRLAADAVTLVLGPGASKEEKLQIQVQLVFFLRSTIGCNMSTHEWLSAFRRETLLPWRKRARTIMEDWDAIDLMIERTDPTKEDGNHLPLSHFGGRIEGSGRLNLSTLHSAKGREFGAVILFAMNCDRQFYVGVTRARRHLYLVCNREHYSPFIAELYRRIQQPYT